MEMEGNEYGVSKEAWDALEAPLIQMDTLLESFAREHGITFTSNGRGGREWPERSLKLSGDIYRLIQIYAVSEKQMTFNFWLCASQLRGPGNFWKSEFIAKEVPAEELISNARNWLEQAYKKVSGWNEADLELVKNI